MKHTINRKHVLMTSDYSERLLPSPLPQPKRPLRKGVRHLVEVSNFIRSTVAAVLIGAAFLVSTVVSLAILLLVIVTAFLALVVLAVGCVAALAFFIPAALILPGGMTRFSERG